MCMCEPVCVGGGGGVHECQCLHVCVCHLHYFLLVYVAGGWMTDYRL